jgi:hypothetical protein
MNRKELEELIKSLVGFLKRYYEFLPDVCWMSEENQAKGMKSGRTRLRTAKRKLVEMGLIQVDPAPNGNRQNLKHIIRKTYPIILRASELEHQRYGIEEEEYYYIHDINWSLLQNYTAEDINGMDKLDKVRLYQECGFIVLPTHYPIFTDNSVKCSCSREFDCPNKGKHPIHKYKFIDGLNYDDVKEIYFEEFRQNPNLNIGFKVSGFSVLDVDNRHNGDKTLEQLAFEYDIDFNHVISVKCSNGQHIYVSNRNLKNTAGFIGEGLDVRSEGGFIVAPGSLHKSGKAYKWNEIGELATIPRDWFEKDSVEVATSKSGNQKAGLMLQDIKLPNRLTSDYVIKDGERHLTLFKWACRERGNGANAERLYDILITIRDSYCETGEEPITDDEIRFLADSVAKNFPTNSEKGGIPFKPENN